MTARPTGAGLPAFEPGTVWLVGAGPGDPGLLTRLAAKALEEADVVVHDALVGNGILALARADALVVDVGKRARCRSARQEEINDRLVAYARFGRRVLRLKGGDPFVFGRGGEEALALAAAGVPFRVVPGITAGIGALSYASIPLTHRGLAATATFVTGHGQSGGVPDGIDWAALANGSQVLVFYMALGTIATIAERLIAAGKPPMTPVAVVSNGSLAGQTVIETNLARCARDIRRLAAASPAIIAVGEVVRLRRLLAPWQQAAPAVAPAPAVAVGGGR